MPTRKLENPRPRLPPIVEGQRFGRLVLLRPLSPTAPAGQWVAKCDCGARTYPRASMLRSKDRPVTSCGCAQHGHQHGSRIGGVVNS